MNDILTSVYKPTAKCIWTAFQSSGRRHLMLTGSCRADKAELLSALRHYAEKESDWECVDESEDPESRCREDIFLVDLDAPYGNTGCVIMASGMGKRFGGNKLMAHFRGRPLILWALEATAGIFSQRVVVTRHRDVADLCTEYGVHVILHDLPYRSDTVRLGIEALPNVDSCMFCPGDQPLLSQETVATLVLAAVNDRDSIWRAAFDGIPGSPVLFPAQTFPELLTLPEGKGGGFVTAKYPNRVRAIDVQNPYELMDVDQPEDLVELEKRNF